MKRIVSPLLLIGFLAACDTTNVSQYAISGAALEPARASGTAIEVFEVSLPLYMQSQEIPVMGLDGAIRSNSNALWADDPSRAISLNLAEALARLSGGVAAVEPWPLDEPAKARLDVRVKTLLPDWRPNIWHARFSENKLIATGTLVRSTKDLCKSLKLPSNRRIGAQKADAF